MQVESSCTFTGLCNVIYRPALSLTNQTAIVTSNTSILVSSANAPILCKQYIALHPVLPSNSSPD